MRSSTGKAKMEVSSKRSSRLLPPTYATSLVFSHGKNNHDHTFCTLCDEKHHVKSIPEMRGMRCDASHYGWLILIGYKSSEACLFNPVSLVKIDLPLLPDNSFHAGVLTSPPSDCHCVVFLFSEKKKICIFCRIGDTNWTMQELTRDKKIRERIAMTLVYTVACEGKIYLFCYAGIFVVDFGNKSTFASIKRHDKNDPWRPVPWIPCSQNFYVESCGELFMVEGIYLGYLGTFISFDVFKLDRSNIEWVEVECLGDRIFLLAGSCSSVSATEIGVKGNCIYFFHIGYTCLYKFDMDDGTIKITLPYPHKFTHWAEPIWVAPNCKSQVNKGVVKFRESKCGAEQEEISSWKDLPAELLQLIFSSLFLGDCIRFLLTCKMWSSIDLPLRSNPTLVQSNSEALKLPWLISFPKINKGVCNFHHPIYSDVYTMSIPQLAGAIIREARYGWLLVSREEYSVFFFNPVTQETIKLPDLRYVYAFMGITFSSPPTSSDCIVYGHRPSFGDTVEMWVYRKAGDTGRPHGEEGHCEGTWCEYKFDIEYEFQSSFCNPVFFDGVFYILNEGGKVGTFNTLETAKDLMWGVLPVQSLSSSAYTMRSIIVEYDGEIMCVFMGDIGNPIWIYKLDELKTMWIRVESLGDKVIFISGAASIMVRAGLKGIENRIYFSRFHGEDSVYYSLSTGRYHCFGSKYSREDWIDTRGHWSCSWMQFTN